MLVMASRFKKVVTKATREVRKQQSNMVAVVQQGLESMRVVKAFGRQDLEQEELSEVSRATVEAALKARRVKALLSPMVTIIVSLCTAIVLWRGSSLILAGTMTAGSLIVFLSYLSQFFKSVKDLASITNQIAQTAVGVERVRGILEADIIIPERLDALDPQAFRGEIEFDQVAFAYASDAPVLQRVCFTIKPGQMVGIVGATGGGKSTIVSLIPRFYDPTGGKVLIDGVDIRDYKLQALRNQIGYVLQDTVLFRGTIRDNIAYGRAGATNDAILVAAKLANVDEFIARMPHGYDTMVGERGETLSGGQRQRIGIARAVIRNNPILILDESTAALDTESERAVIEALNRPSHSISAMKGCWPICRTPKKRRAWGSAPTAESTTRKERKSLQDRSATLLKRISGNSRSGLKFPVPKRRCRRNCSQAFLPSGRPAAALVDLLWRAA